MTHPRTPRNDEVVAPSSTILVREVTDFSSLARSRGLILHSTGGIGYETPWRQVEAMLLLTAERTPGLLREPEPFVLQWALVDFCVTYELIVSRGKRRQAKAEAAEVGGGTQATPAARAARAEARDARAPGRSRAQLSLRSSRGATQ